MKAYNFYPVRTARKDLECDVCGGEIKTGERYFDGGVGKRYKFKSL